MSDLGGAEEAALSALAAVATRLLGRAVSACLALEGAAAGPQRVWVELEHPQGGGSQQQLRLKVCDNGHPLPTAPVLETVFAGLACPLGHPCFGGGALAVRTTALDELIIRRFALAPEPAGLGMAAAAVGADPKPPSAHFSGSECSLVVSLEAGLCADAVVGCVDELLGMLRMLAPPLQLHLRARGVLLQDGSGTAGQLRPASFTLRKDLGLEAEGRSPLQLFAQGLESEYGPSQAAAGQPAAAATYSPGAAHPTTPHQGPAAHLPGPALQPPQQQQLTYIGVGQAGWGCEGGATHFRGCKWVLQAGVVLLMPNHAGSPPVQPGSAQGSREGAPTPVFLLRSHAMQLEAAQQAAALTGLQRCDWGAYGFSPAAGAAAGGAGRPLSVTLRCVQPRSGARLEAVVLHLLPCEARGEAASGRPLPLSPSLEARLVRAGVEAALAALRQRCPAVVASRRDRCHMRALPSIASSITAVMAASEAAGRGLMGQGCGMVGCQPAEMEGQLGQLLHGAVQAAVAGRRGGSDGI